MGKIGFLPDESQDQGNRQSILFRGLDDARLQGRGWGFGSKFPGGQGDGSFAGQAAGTNRCNRSESVCLTYGYTAPLENRYFTVVELNNPRPIPPGRGEPEAGIRLQAQTIHSVINKWTYCLFLQAQYCPFCHPEPQAQGLLITKAKRDSSPPVAAHNDKQKTSPYV